MARKLNAAGAAIAGDYKVVAVDALQPNPRNPNRQSKFVHKKLLESIREFGFTDPIIVRKRGAGYEIIGGEHRWRAAQSLGMEKVPILDIGPVPDHVANRLMIVLNEMHGQSDQDALAALIQDVKATGGDALLAVLPYTEAQLADFLDEEPVPVDDDVPPPPSGPVKLKASDVLSALELPASDQKGIIAFMEGLREWSRTRPPKAPPVWQGILELLGGG